MPIVNYEQNAEKARGNFFDRKDISKKNKDDVTLFLDQYNVSPARETIFFNHIVHLLKKTKDLKKDMHNPDVINKIFKELHGDLSSSYYDTVVNVSKRLATWLNDGVKPKGFKDVKGVPKKKQKRNINKDDMVTWDEFLKISKEAKSIQLACVPVVQGDGGFRPSEFIDLNYGDCKRNGKFITVHVSEDHKTGEREVTLYKSVPFLLRWLDRHPTKKAKDPLWIMENPSKSHSKSKDKQRYSYAALLKRVKKLASDVKVKKPMDFYNLRHSACVLAKKENMPIDLAAEKFGHSTNFFVNVYGRLDEEDVVGRHKLHYNEVKAAEKGVDKPIECQVCSYINEPKTENCEKCHSALSLKKALEETSEVNELRKEMAEMKQTVQKLAIEEIKKALHEANKKK